MLYQNNVNLRNIIVQYISLKKEQLVFGFFEGVRIRTFERERTVTGLKFVDLLIGQFLWYLH